MSDIVLVHGTAPPSPRPASPRWSTLSQPGGCRPSVSTSRAGLPPAPPATPTCWPTKSPTTCTSRLWWRTRPPGSCCRPWARHLDAQHQVWLAEHIAAARSLLDGRPAAGGGDRPWRVIAGNGVRRPRAEDAFGLGPGFPRPYPTAQTGPGGDHVCDAGCADAVAEAIDTRGAETVAAVIIEPVSGTTGGAFVPPDGWLRRVSEICRERGVVIIHDEVLTGLWRAGKPLASQHWDDTAPDSCILSKGLGAGYTPAAAVLVDPELAPLLKAEDADPLPAMGTMAATPIQSATCLGSSTSWRASTRRSSGSGASDWAAT